MLINIKYEIEKIRFHVHVLEKLTQNIVFNAIPTVIGQIKK